jgi:ATP-dependent 26S proteasome regulatory subunit
VSCGKNGQRIGCWLTIAKAFAWTARSDPIATANDPTCLDAAILKRPGRFVRVVQFRNPDADLRREYYQRLSPTLTGEQFEVAIDKTEGFSFAQLRETFILGPQSAFEDGREISVADVIEAIEFQAAGAQDLKTSVSATGFVSNAERTALH